MAFLHEKAFAPIDLQERAIPTAADCSISEDLEIFARHWRDTGAIDERSWAAYEAMAEHFRSQLPEPDYIDSSRSRN